MDVVAGCVIKQLSTTLATWRTDLQANIPPMWLICAGRATSVIDGLSLVHTLTNGRKAFIAWPRGTCLSILGGGERAGSSPTAFSALAPGQSCLHSLPLRLDGSRRSMILPRSTSSA